MSWGKQPKKKATPPKNRRRSRGKTIWKRKAIALAKDLARKREGNKCQWCGRVPKSLMGTHAAHIVPVEYQATAADPDNILCLCFTCHRLGWHMHPLKAAAWFIQAFGKERFAKALRVKRTVTRSALEWQAIYNDLMFKE